MKRVKLFVVLCAILVLAMISACGDTAQEPNGAFTIDEIQSQPDYYVGEITLVGIVGNSNTRAFSLQNEAGTFEIQVDYRGSQALPYVGERVIATGRLSENRRCCGPGFTLTTTRFELAE